MSSAWHRVTSESEAASLLDAFGSFHDSCLKEALVSTEAYVAPNLAMQCPGTLHNRVRLLFQRQDSPISALELLFAQVTSLHLRPAPEGCDPIISYATLSLSAGVFTLAAYLIGGPIRLLPGQEPPPRSGMDGVFVSGRELSWREAPGWLGAQTRYGALEDRA
jgi:hypothetical protein